MADWIVQQLEPAVLIVGVLGQDPSASWEEDIPECEHHGC